MNTLFCPKCQEEKEFYTELKANQNTARCVTCNTYIKNVPYKNPAFYVGKYKNVEIAKVHDLDYLKWALAKMSGLNARTKDAIRSQIAHLEYLAK